MQLLSSKKGSSGLSGAHSPQPPKQIIYNRICSGILCVCILCVSVIHAQQEIPSQQENSEQNVTYVVKDGDTFWDLAFEFTGDPFEWPFIWKGNPHIKNPHLIYPGDSVLISAVSGKDGTFGGKDSLSGKPGQSGSFETNSKPPASETFSGIKGKYLLSTRFFSAVPFLWTKKDSSGNMYPGNAVVEKPLNKGSYQLFDIISIRPVKGASFVPGDTLDVFASIRFVRFRSSIANLVKKVGRVTVVKVEQKRISARLFEMSEVIKGGERAGLFSSVSLKGVYNFSQPENPVKAEIFERVESTPSPYLFQTLIIDQGEAQGIRIGDVFAVYHKNKDKEASYSMTGYVAYVNKESSSLIIVSISSNTVTPGDSATLILRSIPVQ